MKMQGGQWKGETDEEEPERNGNTVFLKDSKEGSCPSLQELSTVEVTIRGWTKSWLSHPTYNLNWIHSLSRSQMEPEKPSYIQALLPLFFYFLSSRAWTLKRKREWKSKRQTLLFSKVQTAKFTVYSWGKGRKHWNQIWHWNLNRSRIITIIQSDQKVMIAGPKGLNEIENSTQ